MSNYIAVERWMRKRGVKVLPYRQNEFGFCRIEVNTNRVHGVLCINLTMTEREADALLQGLGIVDLEPEKTVDDLIEDANQLMAELHKDRNQ